MLCCIYVTFHHLYLYHRCYTPNVHPIFLPFPLSLPLALPLGSRSPSPPHRLELFLSCENLYTCLVGAGHYV